MEARNKRILSMNNLNDPHGQRGLPRSGLLSQRARAIGLSVASGADINAVVAKHFDGLSDERKRQITRIQNANEVPSVDFPASTADAQLIAAVAQTTFLGRLPLAWDLPLNTHLHALAAEVPEAHILTDGKPIPLRAGSFNSATMSRITAKALTVVSVELLSQPTCEPALNAMLLRAAARAVDKETLARALNGADPLASGAASPEELRLRIREAVAALVAAGADPAGIAWAAHPTTCLDIGTYPTLGGDGAFPGVNIGGGNIAGMPLFATLGAEEGTLTAVASDCVGRTLLPPVIDASKSGNLEFSSAPTGEAEPGQTPVAASQVRVSLFQSAMVALRVDAPFSVAFGRDLRAVQIADVLPEIATA
jgi:hypothetical protein